MQFKIMCLSLSLISSLAYSAAPRTYEERYGPASLSDAINFCTTIPCIPKAIQFFIRTHPHEEALVKSDEIKSLILHKKQEILKKILSIIEENRIKHLSMKFSKMKVGINELIQRTDKLNDYSAIYRTLQDTLSQAVQFPDTTESLFKILIENGASPELDLLFIIPYNMPSLSNVSHLIKYGLNVNGRDVFRDTALIKLALSDKKRSLEVAKFLVSRGADINLADRYGDTPLMRAVGKRPYPFLDMVEWLLHAGADISKRDNEGYTALGFAQRRSQELSKELEYYRKSRKGYAWFIIEDTSQYRQKEMFDEIIRLLEEAELQQRVRAGHLMAAPAV